MSAAPSPLPVQPVPVATSIQNIIYILISLVSLLGGMHLGPIVKPTPAPVPPAPIIIQQVPPAPVVDPAPLPPVILDKPIAVEVPGTQITDSAGHVLTGPVQAGQIVTVSAPADQKLISMLFPAVPPGDKHGEVTVLSDEKFVFVLQPGEKLQITTYGSGKPTQQMVTCLLSASIPPPVVTPTVPTVVTSPQKVLLSVDIIVDRPAVTKPVAIMLENFAYWSKFRDGGHDWRVYHITDSTDRAVQDIAAIKTASAVVPGIVIRNKTTLVVLYAGGLPTTQAAMDALFSQYGVQV